MPPASNTVNWNDGLMSTPTPNKAATQGGEVDDYLKMWTPHNGTASYIQFDLGAATPLSEIYLWQYNQGTVGNRSIQTANIYYAATYPGQPAKTSTAGWTQYNPNNFPWPQATGAPNDHTVVDMQNLGFTARYVEIDPTSDWGANDVHGGLSKTLFYRQPVSFANTTFDASASSTLDLGGINRTLGTLRVAGGSTLAVSNSTGVTAANLETSGTTGTGVISYGAIPLTATNSVVARHRHRLVAARCHADGGRSRRLRWRVHGARFVRDSHGGRNRHRRHPPRRPRRRHRGQQCRLHQRHDIRQHRGR